MNKKKMDCKRLGGFIAAAVLLSACATASADQFGIKLAAGIADQDIQKIDLGVMWDPNITWWETDGWHFSLVGEADVSYWRADRHSHGNIYEFGVTPMVRFIKRYGSIRPYIEAGIGIRVLSHPTISDSYTLSTAFQFTDIIGVGAQFGRHQQYQAGLRFQHISNGSIKTPNPGINFSQIYFQYNF